MQPCPPSSLSLLSYCELCPSSRCGRLNPDLGSAAPLVSSIHQQCDEAQHKGPIVEGARRDLDPGRLAEAIENERNRHDQERGDKADPSQAPPAEKNRQQE